jgi:hypothetical protein
MRGKNAPQCIVASATACGGSGGKALGELLARVGTVVTSFDFGPRWQEPQRGMKSPAEAGLSYWMFDLGSGALAAPEGKASEADAEKGKRGWFGNSFWRAAAVACNSGPHRGLHWPQHE